MEINSINTSAILYIFFVYLLVKYIIPPIITEKGSNPVAISNFGKPDTVSKFFD